MNFFHRIYRIHQHVPAPWLVAAVLVVCFLLFSLRQKMDPASLNDAETRGFPHIYMQSVETREFDAQGRLHYYLVTPKVMHFQAAAEGPSDADYTIIERPKMTFYDPEATAPWIISAEVGRSEANGQLLRLLTDVLIQQQTPTQGLIRITTSELRVRASQQFAETDKAVNMRSAKGQIDAVGMDADLAQSRLQLKSQVKAVYDPR